MYRRAPNSYAWDFPDVIKFRVAAHRISEKAIRFRHPYYNPDRAQKLITSSMSDVPTSVDTQHFIQIHARVNERGQTHLPPLLSQVISVE